MTTEPLFQPRRKILIDRSLQGMLIVSFVVLEILILGGALAYLHYRLGNIFEDLIFRTHLETLPDLGQILLSEGITVIAVCTTINAIALIIADGLWRRHVKRILTPFLDISRRVAELNFSQLPQQSSHKHEVIDLAARWLQNEHDHLRRIEETLVRLESLPTSDRVALADVLDTLLAKLDRDETGRSVESTGTR